MSQGFDKSLILIDIFGDRAQQVPRIGKNSAEIDIIRDCLLKTGEKMQR